MRPHKLLRGAMGVAALSLVLAACGDDQPDESAASWPNKTIDFIVPYGTGGSTDAMGREFVKYMEREVDGVTFRVSNIDGGSGTIGMSRVINDGDPDGHIMGIVSPSTLGFQPLVNPDVSWATTDDYQPIVRLAIAPALITVRADAPWDTLEEFFEAAKTEELTISTSGALTQVDQNVLLFQNDGYKITNVPFEGGGADAIAALLSGDVDATGGYISAVQGLVDSGDAKVIGVVFDERYDAFPDVQTTGELGSGSITPTQYLIVGPPGIPDDVLDQIVEASLAVADNPEFSGSLENQGFVPAPLGPAELTEELQRLEGEFKDIKEIIDATD